MNQYEETLESQEKNLIGCTPIAIVIGAVGIIYAAIVILIYETLR